jgi:hypothetical protein
MTKLFDLIGKVAVVTGSMWGIGRAIAQAMARAGTEVVISSREVDKCDEVVCELLSEGLDAHPIPSNVGKKEDLQKLVSETRRHFRPIDCLVLNAAINPHRKGRQRTWPSHPPSGLHSARQGRSSIMMPVGTEILTSCNCFCWNASGLSKPPMHTDLPIQLGLEGPRLFLAEICQSLLDYL